MLYLNEGIQYGYDIQYQYKKKRIPYLQILKFIKFQYLQEGILRPNLGKLTIM